MLMLMKINSTIAAHLRCLATERAAAGLRHRADRYTAAAARAAASTQDLADLDSAGVQEALGCRDKIAGEVLRLVQAVRVLELAEGGDRASAAALAADLTGQIPEVLRDRCTRVIVSFWTIEQCFAAVAAHEQRQQIRWVSMVTAAHLAGRAGNTSWAEKFERVAAHIDSLRPQEFVAAKSRDLGTLGLALAERLAEYTIANPDAVQDVPVPRPVRVVAVGNRVLRVLDGGATPRPPRAGGGRPTPGPR